MNIFGGRPGIAAGILAVVAILAAAFLSLSANVVLLALTVIAVAACGTLLAFGVVKPYRFFSVIVVFFVLATAWSRGMNFFYRSAPQAKALCKDDSYVHATVAERYVSGDYYTFYIIRMKSVNGVVYEGKALLECEYNSDLQVGYEFVLRSADVKYILDLAENDAVLFIADEMYLYIISSAETDCHILSEGNYTFSDRLGMVNSYLCARLKNTIGGDAGRLAAAMLLGDRDSLSPEMYRDFRRAGISHYLAVSGLHVSIITGLVSFVLINLRIKRGFRNSLIVLFAVGYLLILGFPVSAVRSVTMLTIVFLAYSMGDNSDTLNSLGIVAAIIVIISPTAVFDKSFILSFSATLGIGSFLPVLTSVLRKFKKEDEEKGKKCKKIRKMIYGVIAAIMTTFSAVSTTLLPTALMFGETSLFAPISNLILAPIGAPMLASSFLCLIFGKVPYLGDALTFAVKVCSGVMLQVASRVSDIRGVSLSLVSRGAIVIVILFTLILAAALMIKIKKKESLLIIPALYPLVLVILSLSAVAALPTNAELTCLSTGSDEVIYIQNHKQNVIIDISDGSYSRLHAASDFAKENGATEFETVMLTHYHNRHVSALSRFTAEEKVRLVILPYPTTEDEAWMMVQITNTLQKFGVGVRVIAPEGEVLITDDITVAYPKITRIERSAHPITYLSFSDGRQRVTYVSSSSWENGQAFECKLNSLVEKSNTVLIGAHGPVIKEVFNLPVRKADKVYYFGEDLDFVICPETSIPLDRTTINTSIVRYVFEEAE